MSFFSPIPFPGARRPATAISLFGSNSNFDSATISLPGGIIAGDLIVLGDFQNIGNTPVAVTPPGFTTASNITQAADGGRMMLSYKLANGSEGGATITGLNGPELFKAVYVFRGNFPAIALTPSVASGQASAGNPTAQTVAAAGAAAPLVVIGFYCSNQPFINRIMTPAKDGEITPDDAQCYLAYKIYNTAPTNVIVDCDDAGPANFLQSMYIRMA